MPTGTKHQSDERRTCRKRSETLKMDEGVSGVESSGSRGGAAFPRRWYGSYNGLTALLIDSEIHSAFQRDFFRVFLKDKIRENFRKTGSISAIQGMFLLKETAIFSQKNIDFPETWMSCGSLCAVSVNSLWYLVVIIVWRGVYVVYEEEVSFYVFFNV
jgi:hypothetical protein